MPAGRPARLTDHLIMQLADRVRSGIDFNHACADCDIPPQTGNEWLMRGHGTTNKPLRDAKPIYRKLAAAIDKARGAYLSHLELMAQQKCIAGDGKMLRWMLMKKAPKIYGSQQGLLPVDPITGQPLPIPITIKRVAVPLPAKRETTAAPPTDPTSSTS